jgi:hypothetical protein
MIASGPPQPQVAPVPAAYKLYEEEQWIKQFGSVTQPYLEEYRPSSPW